MWSWLLTRLHLTRPDTTLDGIERALKDDAAVRVDVGEDCTLVITVDTVWLEKRETYSFSEQSVTQMLVTARYAEPGTRMRVSDREKSEDMPMFWIEDDTAPTIADILAARSRIIQTRRENNPEPPDTDDEEDDDE